VFWNRARVGGGVKVGVGARLGVELGAGVAVGVAAGEQLVSCRRGISRKTGDIRMRAPGGGMWVGVYKNISTHDAA
jgi:hypothetical protein